MTAPNHRLLPIVLLVLYLVVLFTLALRPSDATNVQTLNLVPFSTIARGLRRGGSLFFINIVGNIVVFMPLGALLPSLYFRLQSWMRILIIGIAVSVLIEVLQLMLGQRVTDVDDVLLNTAGTLLGYGCYLLVRQV